MKHKKSLIILLLAFIFISSNIMSDESREYEITKLEDTEKRIYYTGCIIIDKKTGDTIYSLLSFWCEFNRNYFINENYLYKFVKFYQGMSDPPTNELLVSRYDILSDTILFKDNYSFGHYHASVSSKFEEDKLTVFKGDSVLEFDLDKFKVIIRFKNKNKGKKK